MVPRSGQEVLSQANRSVLLKKFCVSIWSLIVGYTTTPVARSVYKAAITDESVISTPFNNNQSNLQVCAPSGACGGCQDAAPGMAQVVRQSRAARRRQPTAAKHRRRL